MVPRLTVVTFGVRDLSKLYSFHECSRLTASCSSGESVFCFPFDVIGALVLP